jgi:hypothetical protein
VAAVVGCTALAAAILGGLPEGDDGPGMALPDGGRLPTPQPTEPDLTADGTPQDPPRETPGASPGEAGGGSGDGQPEADTDTETGTGPETGPDSGASPSPQETEGSGSVGTPEPSPSATGAGGTLPPDDPTDPGPTPDEPAPTATDNPVPLVLREGDRGPEVIELQRRLRQLNWLYEGGAHGRFDAATREAVATFQEAYGVRGDEGGVYGVNTRARLEESTTEP